jgi:SAM-dependent methyltransferase
MQDRAETGLPDLLTVPRYDLVKANIIHDFARERVLANLAGCYGRLIRERYRSLLEWVRGRRIIDCGCGFGTFSRVALDAGFVVAAVDIDDESLEIARQISGIPCRRESIYATSLPDRSCDTAVCCDSIQHFELEHFLTEIKRLGVGRVIVYDSNVHNPLLRLYRRLAGHEESHDRTPEELIAQFRRYGFELTHMQYENVVALALSGGLQRPPVPGVKNFPRAVERLDHVLAAIVRRLGFGRLLSFRFLIILSEANAVGQAGLAEGSSTHV